MTINLPPKSPASILDAANDSSVKGIGIHCHIPSKMLLQDFPNELLLLIASSIDTEADLNALAQVNQHFYNTLIATLYKQDAGNPKGSSALKHAVRYGKLSIVRKALQAGADVNTTTIYCDEECPLICDAARSGVVEVFELLLDAGADVLVKDEQGRTPLFHAAEYGHAEIVRILLDIVKKAKQENEKGLVVDPNTPDRWTRTPLIAACTRGHRAVVDILLSTNNTDLESQDHLGFTALHQAARQNHADIVSALLSHGADANSVERRFTQTHMHSTIYCKQPEVLKLLVNRDGVDPNELFLDETPLQFAVHQDREDLVRLLLSDRRVKPDFTVLKDGRTPLLKALVRGQDAVARLLLDAGADPEIVDSGGLSPGMLMRAADDEARRELLGRFKV